MNPQFHLTRGEIIAADTPTESLATSSANPPSEVAGPLGSLAVATGSPEAVRAIEAAVTALEHGWRDLLEWEQLATNTRKALKDAGKSPDHEPYCPSERGIARTEIVRHELGRAATDLRKLLPRENVGDETRTTSHP